MAILKYTVAVILSGISCMAFAASNNSVASYTELAKRCAPKVNITTLTALLRNESSLDPYAINVNDGTALDAQPTNRADAVAAAQQLIESGHNIDVGLGQVNSANFDRVNQSLDELFTPCSNLKAASQILHACYARAVPRYEDKQDALQASLSCYNTGNFSDGFANGYVDSVASKVALTIPELLPIAESTGSKAVPDVKNQHSQMTRTDHKPSGTSAIFVSNTAEPSSNEDDNTDSGDTTGMFAGRNSGAPSAAESTKSHAKRAPLQRESGKPTRFVRSPKARDGKAKDKLTGEGKK